MDAMLWHCSKSGTFDYGASVDYDTEYQQWVKHCGEPTNCGADRSMWILPQGGYIVLHRCEPHPSIEAAIQGAEAEQE